MTLYNYTPCVHCIRFVRKTGRKTRNKQTCICRVDDITETIAIYHPINRGRCSTSEQLPCRYFRPSQTSSYTQRMLHSRRIE